MHSSPGNAMGNKYATARKYALHDSETQDGKQTAVLLGTTSDRPRWDAHRRELTLRGKLVKRFRQPAENQERILTAFEEEGWPPAISDPLPGVSGIDPCDRLHNAIQRLNSGQRKRLLRFERDGTGGGILWKVAARCRQ